MTRKLALLLAACLGLWHGPALALGLGEIRVQSALNERFSAEIELRRIDDLSPNEIIASLASADDFQRLGIQRFFYLSELEFSTDLSDPRRPLIRVTSNRPINEPFVNFVIDVRWPTGRLMREYTVLLDPPVHARRPEPVTETVVADPPAVREPTRVRTEPAAPPPERPTGRFDGDTYGVTDRSDTLWAIALEVRPSNDVSVQQTMLALQRLNPEAFIGGNINLLKAGYVLQVPDAQEIRRLSRQDAVVQVAEHNSRWRQGTPAMPIDARPDDPSGRPVQRPSGELRLVAGEDDEVRVARTDAPAAGSGDAAADETLVRELADAEGRIERADSARADAERRYEAASRQLEDVSRQLELRNQELARLQRQLAAQQADSPADRGEVAGPFGLSWLIIGGGMALLVGLVAGGLVVMRRRSDSARTDDPLPGADADDGGLERTQLMSAISQEDLARAGVAGAAAGAAAAAGGERDVIAEADVCMAYGKFSDAAQVLNSAIEEEPNRADLRLKLMEVQVETQDVDGFNTQAEALRGFADSQTLQLADDLAARLPGAVTSTGEISEGVAGGSGRSADEGEVNLDFDLGEDIEGAADLDSLDIDLDMSGGAEPEDAAGDEGEGLELGLDLDALDSSAEDEQAAAEELDFDLELPGDDEAPRSGDEAGALDLELDVAAETDGSGSDGDDFDLDFDLDSKAGDEDSPTASADDALDLDFDLPADSEDDAPAKSGDGDLDFDLELPAESGESGQPVAAEAEGDDLDFDLALADDTAGGDDDTPATADAGLGDLELSLEDGAGQASAAETEAEDDGLDFDIGDLPADLDSGDDSAASAGTGDDEFALELADETVGEAVDGAAPDAAAGGELAVDLEDDGLDLEFDLDMDDAGDETATKLELARAYIDMGDEDGAREILDEVVRDGSDAQQQQAGELLAKLG